MSEAEQQGGASRSSDQPVLSSSTIARNFRAASSSSSCPGKPPLVAGKPLQGPHKPACAPVRTWSLSPLVACQSER
eukprot:730607-Hanusia_phi.AAC.1